MFVYLLRICEERNIFILKNKYVRFSYRFTYNHPLFDNYFWMTFEFWCFMTKILPLLYELFLLSFIICKIFFSEQLNAPIVPLLPSLSPSNVNCYYLPLWYVFISSSNYTTSQALCLCLLLILRLILCAEIILTITQHVVIDAECRWTEIERVWSVRCCTW